jgi:hypothetical protein
MIDLKVILVEAKLDRLKITSLLGEKRECGQGSDAEDCAGSSSDRIFYYIFDGPNRELLIRKPCKKHLHFYEKNWLECEMRNDENSNQ